jgi:chromosome partitioning protein
MTKTKVIAISNQKGGVGKTTTTINLGTALSTVHQKILIIDLDPQGNASTGLGVRPEQRKCGSYEILLQGASLADAVMPTAIPNLYLVPATADLSGAEIELVNTQGREFCLKKAIEASQNEFDFILLDCPPALGLLNINALAASNGVLIPLQCEFYALEGLSQLIRTIQRVRNGLNQSLDIMGIVLTMYDKRNNLSEMVEQDVRSFFGNKVYKTIIPRNVKISEAPSHGLPAIIYDYKCVGSQAYIHLAKEILNQQKEEERMAA